MFCFMCPKLFATGGCAWSESPRIPDGLRAAPCSLRLGIIQFTNVEHLGNLGAKKSSSWLDVAKIPGPPWCQGIVSGMFCFCCGANNKAAIYSPLLYSRHRMEDVLRVRHAPIPSILTALNPLSQPRGRNWPAHITDESMEA